MKQNQMSLKELSDFLMEKMDENKEQAFSITEEEVIALGLCYEKARAPKETMPKDTVYHAFFYCLDGVHICNISKKNGKLVFLYQYPLKIDERLFNAIGRSFNQQSKELEQLNKDIKALESILTFKKDV